MVLHYKLSKRIEELFMHKGLVGGVVVLALVGAGVGGYFVIDNKVRTAVQNSFDHCCPAILPMP